MRIGRWGLYVAVVLTLAFITWVFFYMRGMPLDPSATSFVVIAWAVIAGLVWSGALLYRRPTVARCVLVVGGWAAGVSALVVLAVWAVDHLPAVRIGAAPGSLPVETGREILYPSENEDRGYALYSYIFFRGAATPQNEDRYLAALTAFRDEIPEIRDLMHRRAKRSELNIAYILLRKRSPARAKPDATVAATDVPRFWLEEYDFARARLLLRAVPGAMQDGPYIVSYDRPLSTIEHELGREDLLLQDLSWVPAALVRVWVKEFLRQARQPGAFAKEDLWRQLTLKTRTGIEVAAQGLPQVEKAWADAKERWDTAVRPVKPESKTE
jgi:hypothetical protein